MKYWPWEKGSNFKQFKYKAKRSWPEEVLLGLLYVLIRKKAILSVFHGHADKYC